MFETRDVDGHVVVTGYPDGSEWIFEAWGRAGTAGPNGARLWQVSPEGRLATYDSATRAQLGEALLGPIESDAVILSGRDRNALYVVRKLVTGALNPDGTSKVEAEVLVVDLDAFTVVGRNTYPIGGFDKDVMLMPGGAILIAGEGRRDNAPGAILGRIDPVTGEFADSFVPFARVPDGSARTRWLSHSPDGR